jgi:hypothetical protein
MDQTASDATIAVTEGVDDLKLGMSDRGLSQHREVLALDELAQVREQGADPLDRGRHKIGVDRGAARPADPVLRGPPLSAAARVRGVLEQEPVDLVDHLDAAVNDYIQDARLAPAT